IISAETTSSGVSSRPRCLYRAMTSRQTKLGRFSENSKAAPLALSIKASEGLSERVRMESAGADAASGGSGQRGRSGCLPRFKMGGALEQAGVLWDCDCVAGGGAEADCAGCDCGKDPLCAFREIGALKRRASSTALTQLDLRPELTRRMIHAHQIISPLDRSLVSRDVREPEPRHRARVDSSAALRASAI